MKTCKKCGQDKSNYKKSYNKKLDKYYHDNVCKDCRNEEYRKWYYQNREYNLNRVKQYNDNNQQRKKEYNRKYFILNKTKILKKRKDYMRTYNNKRRKNDNNYRLSSLYRSRLYKAFKYGWYSKDTESIVGLSLKDLKAYFAKQFTDIMSWDNYGKEWEIDHIKPCIKFNLENKNELLNCFNYKNIRPLSKKENILKKDKELNYELF